MNVTVVFDSAQLERWGQRDAFREAMIETSGSTRVALESVFESFFGRMDLWSFGASRIFTAASSGVTMSATTRPREERRPRPWPSPYTAWALAATTPKPVSGSSGPAT